MINSSTITQALFASLLESPLLCSHLPEASQFDRSLLQPPTLDFQPNFDQKLGHLYEDLMAHLLESSSAIQLLEKSLQLRAGIHHTLGELDFLLRTPTHLIHLELAIKFYLAVETPQGWHLPGPDARDNYARKIARLRTHQLTLTQKFHAHLPGEYRHQEIHARQLIYGCLFDHIHASEPATTDFIAPNCRRGTWRYPHELPPETKAQLIPKTLWPVPLEFLKDIPLTPWSPPAHLERCVMLRLPQDPRPHFIVPKDYPSTGTSRI